MSIEWPNPDRQAYAHYTPDNTGKWESFWDNWSYAIVMGELDGQPLD